MKRFWRETSVVPDPDEGGFAVRLDERALRTPGKRALLLPSRALAEAIAAEWRDAGEDVRPDLMPLTRTANTTIDRMGAARDEVVTLTAAYGASDLLCYRAVTPDALAERQAAAWDPPLAWAADHFDAPLRTVRGIMPVDQPPESLARLSNAVARHGAWELMALSSLVALSGSLVLGLGVAHGRLHAAEAWNLSRLEEAWNIEEWGDDAEAAAAAALHRTEFLDAARLLDLVRAP